MDKVWDLRIKVIEAQKNLAAERYKRTRCGHYLIEIDYWNDVGAVTEGYSLQRTQRNLPKTLRS